ncbi:MAG: 4-alpha-glucanotransferase [Chlamydiales bacterium]|nr:4-alpha-glucanotransferase [Chlamydiales bacterium]
MDSTNHLATGPTAEQWRTIGVRHHHGINVPLFSLHSKNSCGIGEFTDLIPLIQWCKLVGLDVIQLLPLNDSGRESGPYGALSAFALNPIHLGLAHLQNASGLDALQELNKSPRMQFNEVLQLKERWLRDYFSKEGPEIISSDEYRKFIQSNQWLRGYSLFKTIKHLRNWQRWEEWPEELLNLNADALAELERTHSKEVQYHQFAQFLCFQQFQNVKKAAEDAGVFLKGDIPILINRESADLWEHRQLFLLDYTAGAPPDMYSETGQKWGFPLYNWPAVERQDYKWWRHRLKVASSLYHLYRLDHIVGFFRIFAIPVDKEAKDGFYFPQDESVWLEHGRKILTTLVESSPMLPIGEDLGVIPDGVRPFLAELGICGTKVMRWERYWHTTKQFIPVQEYPPETMTTVSTHDSDTLAGWWKNYPDEAQLYCDFKGWEYVEDLPIAYLFDILKDSHRSGSLFHVNLLQEYLALFPELVNPDPNEERVNVPGTISDQNWTYRFKPSVEEIIAHQALASKVKALVSTH